MQCPLVGVLLAVLVSACQVQSLSYDPDNYLEVYPDPRDPEVLKGRTPLHFALVQSLGGPLSQFDAAGSVAGVKVALDDINDDSSLLPGYTLHYTFADSQCNRKVSLDVLHSLLLNEPTKLAIIGSGCSPATEPTAEVSHYYNITTISCLSTSPDLSNRTRFPRYFQLLSSAVRRALGYYGVIREYGWKRVALIIQNENVFQETMSSLKELLKADEIEYSEREFNTDDGIAGLNDPFDGESRIFVLSMFRIHALPLVCQAYHRNMLPPRYVLMTIGWYLRFWWREEQAGVNCTAEQMEMVLNSSIGISDEVFRDPAEDANVTATPGITVGEFFEREQEFIDEPPLNYSISQYSSYCHDGTWTLAYALNDTLNSLKDDEVNAEIAEAFNIPPPVRLEDFTYSNNKMLEIIFGHLEATSFEGLTGPMRFDENGIRNITNIRIFQYREINESYFERVRIGNVFSSDGNLTYIEGESEQTVWNGLTPIDGIPKKEFQTVHPALTGIYIFLALCGIAFTGACLVFNFVFRNSKLIKLASTQLNYLIGIGAIILYLSIFLYVIPTTDQDVTTVFCNLTPWLTAIGYSFCYGTILAKMARVYYLFNNPSPKKKSVKDRYLMLAVAIMIAIDVTIVFIYTLVEGVNGNLDAREAVHREEERTEEGELGAVTNNCVYICDSTSRQTFLGILYGYKMALQIVALVLAFSIRKVKVKGLDDSKYIGAAIYVTSIVQAVIIVATYSLKEFINGFAALLCTGILAGTTVIIGLVFIPLVSN